MSLKLSVCGTWPLLKAPWTMRKLFKLRDITQTSIESIVGNDNWHPLGPPYKKFREMVVKDIGSSLQAKVSSIIREGEWKWPRQRNRVIMFIMDHTPSPYILDLIQL